MAIQRFIETYGREGEILEARAPGRVNLIGEHTDYNGGYVLPMAIDRSVRIIFRPNGKPVVDLTSVNYGGRQTFDLRALAKREDVSWINYPQGVAFAMQEAGYTLSGFDGIVEGDVPAGAGLSSSAAFEVACALAFCRSSGLDISRRELAQICQRAEHTFAGVKCGIMDMYVSLFAEKDRAVLIDCTTLTHELEPLDGSKAVIIVCDTGVKHELAQSAYNARRAECESALAKLKARLPGVKTYKDISPSDFAAHAGCLEGEELARARHVVSENQRVLDSVRALRAGDLETFGRLMNASHESLSNDYAVSCAELDILASVARKAEGCLGSRMTGGGFGGCTVSLALPKAATSLAGHIIRGYRAATGRE
ncbi:MAG TPA: galactokinase, partial [Candidatus Brocadiia bacterium]|nr:galactokinase [Candidatus Brocadiia bacterium]